MSAKKEVEVKLIDVKEISFSCIDTLSDIPTEKIEDNVDIELGFTFQAEKGSDVFLINCLVVYKYKEEEALRYENQAKFLVKNIEQAVKFPKEGINIKDEFLESLLGVVIGTTRGMLIKNTMGKIINNYPLPILIPKEVLKSMKPKKSIK
ncbi:MAG: hypothetical protein ACTSUW_01770 [Candidatus Heimdallarchaeota archaeon]